MSELETKVARAIWACRKPMNLGEEFAEAEYRRCEGLFLSEARAALKAHAEYLEEQGLEIVCTGRPHSRKPTIAELEKILEGPAGRVRITPAGEVVVEPAKKEDQNHD